MFADRRDAGRQLAAQLSHYADADAVVLALPRGGVPVAVEVAAALDAPLDVIVARKLGAPGRPELGVGAVAEGGDPIFDHDALGLLGLDVADLADTVEAERAELDRRVHRYRGERPLTAVRGRTAVLVDDGLATGVTARAALRALRGHGPDRLVLAVPVAAPRTARRMADEADDVVVVATPRGFAALGQWYRDFAQTADEEVQALLAASTDNRSGAGTTVGGARRRDAHAREVTIPAGHAQLAGDLTVPRGARGVVVFAHGSGSSRHSPRNRQVAATLQEAGLATLLMDLLTTEEEQVDTTTGALRFDIALLATRLVAATDWVGGDTATGSLPVGYFGASTGAACALVAAVERPDVAAVVSRGGRPDLAGAALPRVAAPTLLVVGGADTPVIQMNRDAMARMTAGTRLEIVEGATHLFPEPGALERVAGLAVGWFTHHL
ncbi:MAG: phosphoribosyltransferase family protein [Egibacteraceae bacterium]